MGFFDIPNYMGKVGPRAALKDHQGSGHVLHFVSVVKPMTAHFQAYLTEFTDNYTSEWNETTPFGRMDPIATFKRTGRKINLGWTSPSAGPREGAIHLAEAEKLIQMLYPVYDEYSVGKSLDQGEMNAIDGVVKSYETALKDSQQIKSADVRSQLSEIAKQEILLAKTGTAGGGKRKVGVMAAPPLMYLKFSNLIQRGTYSSVTKAGASEGFDNGLVGYLGGLSFSPVIEDGFYSGTDRFVPPISSEQDPSGTQALIPKTLTFSCEFTVLHTNPMGYRVGDDGNIYSRNPKAPYMGRRSVDQHYWTETGGRQREVRERQLRTESEERQLRAERRRILDFTD